MKLVYYFLFQTKLKSFFLGTHSTCDYNELVMLPTKLPTQNRTQDNRERERERCERKVSEKFDNIDDLSALATHKFALIAAQSFNCLHHGWGVQQTSCHIYYMIYRPRYICVYVSFPNGLCKVSTANMMNVPRQQRVERAANNEKLPNTHQDQTTKNCYTHTQLHTRTAFTYVCRSATYFWAL